MHNRLGDSIEETTKKCFNLEFFEMKVVLASSEKLVSLHRVALSY